MSQKKKPNRLALKMGRSFDDVAMLMDRYFKKWDVVPHGTVTAKYFAEKYWEKMEQKAMGGAVRIILPHNLGYMQVLTHQYAGNSRAFIKENGTVDCSLIWMRHPMFVHHRTNAGTVVSAELREKKKSGVKFLNEYVDGDTYVG